MYIAKIEELRSNVGPIAQRYFDSEEEKRQAERQKRDELDLRKAQEEMARRNTEHKDAEMKDPDGQHQPQVDEVTDRMDI